MSGTLHVIGNEVGERYIIKDYIGQGGMQEVYLAHDRLLDRDVALKSPRTPSATKRFKRSAVVSAKVNHSNVAKTMDYFECSGREYLIEELVVGCNLAEFQRQHVRSLDPYSVAKVFHHLAKGLNASHHAHVIHRDLKPSNIMVVAGKHFLDVKITDFGIAKLAEDEIGQAVEGGGEALTASATALGALPYMSPEMIDEPKSVGKPTDIWALGAMTFELLTGHKPFGDGYKAVPKIQGAVVPPLSPLIAKNRQFSSLSLEIYALILKCMAKDESDRILASDLVEECSRLCYTSAPREYGYISSINFGKHGFVDRENGAGSVFYHVKSGYNLDSIAIGKRVWFSKYPGYPRPRAFPIVEAVPPTTD